MKQTKYSKSNTVDNAWRHHKVVPLPPGGAISGPPAPRFHRGTSTHVRATCLDDIIYNLNKTLPYYFPLKLHLLCPTLEDAVHFISHRIGYTIKHISLCTLPTFISIHND